MIYHFVVGDLAAQPLTEAMQTEASLNGEIIIIRDLFNLGPLQKLEGQKFSELRTNFWLEVTKQEKLEPEIDDIDRMLRAGNELSKNENASIWIWVAPLPADICTYFWLLKYLSKYKERLYIVNIAGLPFLDSNGKLFFPKSIAEIPAKEMLKARKLARKIALSEVEVDGDEWNRLTQENTAIRTLEGGKKIVSRQAEYYDNQILSICTPQFQKASKVISLTLSKFNIPTGDLFIGYRIRKLIEQNRLQIQGDLNKGFKDFEVKLHDGKLL